MKKCLLFFIIIFLVLPSTSEAEIKKIRNISFSEISHNQIKASWQFEKASSKIRFKILLQDQNRNLISKSRTSRKFFRFTDLNSETKYYLKIQAYQSPKKKGKWSVAKSFTTDKEPDKITTTIFGGDVMLSRYVHRATVNSGNWMQPFVKIADEFKQNDLAFINLEAPFSPSGPYYVDDNAMSFKVDPNMIQGLQLAGIDIASLSNNHIYNAGQTGVNYTKQYLVDNGVAYCLENPDIRKVNDLKFAFLCYSYSLNIDINKLISDINSIKNQADVIIVSMHNGAEYTENISYSQSNFAHTAIDHGADLVIGHHPHVVQRLEEYNGKYIFYSLGNLIFDQDWSWPTQLGAVIKITWHDDDISKIEFKPVKIDYDFQPRFMDFEEGKQVLARLQVSNYEINK